MLQIPKGRRELLFFAVPQTVVPLEFVKVMFVLFLKGIIVEQYCGKLSCNALWNQT